MKYVSKWGNYRIQLTPNIETESQGVRKLVRGVVAPFTPQPDKSSICNTAQWQSFNAKSEQQLIKLLQEHKALNQDFWQMREGEPASVSTATDEPKRKGRPKKELVEA